MRESFFRPAGQLFFGRAYFPCGVPEKKNRQVHQNEPPCVVSCRVVSCTVLCRNEPPCTVLFVFFPPSPPKRAPVCRVVFVSCRVVFVSCRVVHGVVSKRAPVYGAFCFVSAKSTKTSPRVSCRVRVVSCSCRVVSCRVVSCCVETSPCVRCFLFCFCHVHQNEPPCVVSCRVVSCRVVSCRVVSCRVVSKRAPVYGAFCFCFFFLPSPPKRAPVCRVVFVSCRVVHGVVSKRAPVYGAFCFFFFRQVHQNEPPCVVSCSCRVVSCSCRVVSCTVLCRNEPPCTVLFVLFLPSPPKRAPVCRVVFVSCRVVSCRVRAVSCTVCRNEPPCTVLFWFLFFSAKSTKTSPRVSCRVRVRVRVVSCRVVSKRAPVYGAFWFLFCFCQVHRNEPPCTVILFFPPSPPKRAPVCRVVSCRVVSCTVVFLFLFCFCQVHQNEPPCTVIFVFPPSPPNEPPCTVSKKKITPKRTPVRGRTTTRPHAWQFATRNANTDRCNTTSPRAWCFFFLPVPEKTAKSTERAPVYGEQKKNHTKTNPRAWANHDGSPCMAICHAKRQHRQVQHDEPPCMVLFFAPPLCAGKKKRQSPPKRAPVCRVVSCRVVSCRVVSKRAPVYGAFWFLFFFSAKSTKTSPRVSCRVVSCRVVSCRVVSCRVKTSPRVRWFFLFLFCFCQVHQNEPPCVVSCSCRVVSCTVLCRNEPPCTVLFVFFPPSPPKRAPVCRVVFVSCSCRVVSCQNEPPCTVLFGFCFFFLPSPPKRAPVCRVVFVSCRVVAPVCRVVSCRVVSCRVKTSPRARCFLCLAAKHAKTQSPTERAPV